MLKDEVPIFPHKLERRKVDENISNNVAYKRVRDLVAKNNKLMREINELKDGETRLEDDLEKKQVV